MTDNQPIHYPQTPTSTIPTDQSPSLPTASGPHPPAIVAGLVFVAIAILGVLVEAGRIPVNWTDSVLLWCGVLGLLAVVGGIVGLVTRRR